MVGGRGGGGDGWGERRGWGWLGGEEGVGMGVMVGGWEWLRGEDRGGGWLGGVEGWG